MWLFGGEKKARSPERMEEPRSTLSARTAYDAISMNRSDVDSFEATAEQVNMVLKRVAERENAEREAAQQERHALELRWLQRLRTSRLESAILAGFSAAETSLSGYALKRWQSAVTQMRDGARQERREREANLQARLRDTGRAEVLRERELLLKQVSDSAMTAQTLRTTLDARSQELERTLLRDTMAFQLQAADASRTTQLLAQVRQKQADTEAKAAEESNRLHELLDETSRKCEQRSVAAEASVARSMGNEVAELEQKLRMMRMSQAIVVRLGQQQALLHRYWKVWAVAASLLLREAGSALLQLELSKQQQRGAHTRAQADLASEVAQARVENMESRLLLQKAEILSQLRPTHELATDKELIIEQRAVIVDAQVHAQAAHAAAVSYGVAQETLAAEVLSAERQLDDFTNSSAFNAERYHAERRAMADMENRLHYDKASMDVLGAEQARTSSELQRASCEINVMKETMQSMEREAASGPPRPAAAGAKAAPTTSKPASAKPAAKPAGRRAPPRR